MAIASVAICLILMGVRKMEDVLWHSGGKEIEMESKLINAINTEIGDSDSFNVNWLLFPPFLILAPFFLLMIWIESLERVSPCVCEALLADASADEKQELLMVVRATSGRPRKRDLSRLKWVLERKATLRKENASLVNLEAACRQSHSTST